MAIPIRAWSTAARGAGGAEMTLVRSCDGAGTENVTPSQGASESRLSTLLSGSSSTSPLGILLVETAKGLDGHLLCPLPLLLFFDFEDGSYPFLNVCNRSLPPLLGLAALLPTPPAALGFGLRGKLLPLVP